MPSPNNNNKQRSNTNSPTASGGGGGSRRKRKGLLTQEPQEFSLLQKEAGGPERKKKKTNQNKTLSLSETKMEIDSSGSSSSSSDNSSSSDSNSSHSDNEKRNTQKKKRAARTPSKAASKKKKKAATAQIEDKIEDTGNRGKKKKAAPKKTAATAAVTAATRKTTTTTTTTRKARSRVPPTASLLTAVETKEEEEATIMPMPPAQLQRTQSTPLELELQNQVMANVNADLESKPPPYTQAPPAHLLKFAPQEPEPGFDNNVDDDDDDVDVYDYDEEVNTEDISVRKGTLQKAHLVLLFLCWSYVAAILLYGFLAPAQKNASSRGHRRLPPPSSYFIKCYRNNVHTKVKYQGICADWDPEDLLECPNKALCWGGTVHDCRFGGKSMGLFMPDTPEYYELAPNKQCVWTQAVNDTVAEMTDALQLWTLAHTCRHKGTTPTTSSKSSLEELPYPKAVWMHNETEQPMFLMTDLMQNLTNPPFNTSHDDDTLQFMQMIQEGGDPSLLVVDNMPDLGKSRRIFGILKPVRDSVVEAGTPLVGLKNPPSRPWYMMSLPIQCWWNNMPIHNTKPGSMMSMTTNSETANKAAMIKGVQEKATTKNMEEPSKSTPRGAMKMGTLDATTSKNKRRTMLGGSKQSEEEDKNLLNLRLRQPQSPSDAKAKFVKPKQRESKTSEKVKATVSKKDKSKQAKTTAGETEQSLLSTGFRSFLDRFESILFLNLNNGDGKADESVSPLWSTYLFPLSSMIGFVVVVYLQVNQTRARLYRLWQPEIANMKDQAMEMIQEASRGGWIVTHLRGAVLDALEEDQESEHYQHLRRNIWPLALKKLQEDERLEHSAVVSHTTGQPQSVLAWKENQNSNETSPVRESERLGTRNKRRTVTIQDATTASSS